MLQNYVKIAWRNLLRHKAFSAINLVGLAIGMAACLLILQYVAFELSFDNFHEKGDRIYRVRQDRYDAGKLSTEWVSGAYAVGNSFKDAFNEIEDYVKVVGSGSVVAEVQGGEQVKIEKVYFASKAFFTVFSYPLIAGDARTALTEPNTVVLSETVANKLFGSASPLGKTIQVNGKQAVKVTGVYADFPVNSHMKPDLLRSYATYLKDMGPDNNPETAWTWDGCLTYLLLRPGTDPQALSAKFPRVVDKLVGAELKKYNAAAIYTLQPLRDIHLYSHYMGEPGPTGDGKTTYLLLGIAFFIAVIAWVNYINLATARAVNRAKEVGIRKTIGSERRQLIVQFISESALLNLLGLILALLIVLVAIPGFNKISGQELSFSLFLTTKFWLSLAALFVVGVFFSGLYPAFVLSGFKPIEVLKGKMIATKQGALLRKSLVVLQFAASLFLLIGTVTVYQQIRFMRKQALGIDIDQTLV
ncbi:MAG: ABC transporter permease, partial [Cytophagaceae bacterium]